jgi:iron complex transport system substrate-binding protein
MSNRLYGILFLGLLVVFASCGGNRKTFVSTDEGDTLTMKYAQRIIIVEHEDYTEVTLKHPWQEGQLLHRYYLVDRNRQELPPVLNHGGTIVRVPLQRAAVFTTVHASLMMNFGRQEAIAAVADSKYMKLPYVHQGISEGRIIDCGDGLSPMVEKIIDAQADAILLSPFENSGGYGRMEEIGIPLIECAEYMETSPLGRAEWMRFYGRLLGCEQKADSLFAVVDSCYHALAQQAGTAQTQPTVLMDKQTGSVWYVTGGRSTIGQLLQDAACHSPFAADEHSGSLPLSFDSVLEKAVEADV